MTPEDLIDLYTLKDNLAADDREEYAKAIEILRRAKVCQTSRHEQLAVR